jgi:hypothetical protein
MITEQGEQIQPLEPGLSQQPVVEVVAINVDNRPQKYISRSDKATRRRPVALRASGQTRRSKGES